MEVRERLEDGKEVNEDDIDDRQERGREGGIEL